MPRKKKTEASSNAKDRITVRLSNNQIQILEELRAKLHTNYSLLVRAILGDFISRNEDSIDRILTCDDHEFCSEMWKRGYEEDSHADNI